MKQYLYLIITDQKKGIIAGGIKVILTILSFIFYFITQVRTLFYQLNLLRSVKLNKPVISVGNITVGGVGKTPLVIFIVEYLKKMGKSPAILSRGYMEKENQNVKSDEELVLEERLNGVPVLIGRNRVDTALKFLERNDVDIFIMDDGFQHQKLKRDLDIVAVDTTNAWGNGYLLPRGILREPINSLKRADIIVLTRTDLDNQETVSIKRFLIEKKICSPVICSSHKPVELKDLYNDELIDINTLKKKKVSVISAIGNGLSFKKTLQLLGAQVGRHFEYCDHYMYTLNDVQIILKECQRSNINTIITTEKDAVKLLEFKSVWDVKIKILVLKIDMMLYEGKDELIERINRLF